MVHQGFECFGPCPLTQTPQEHLVAASHLHVPWMLQAASRLSLDVGSHVTAGSSLSRPSLLASPLLFSSQWCQYTVESAGSFLNMA